MNAQSDWNGQALAAALTEAASLTLSFYRFGIMLRKTDGKRTTDHPVDPAQVALALVVVDSYS